MEQVEVYFTVQKKTEEAEKGTLLSEIIRRAGIPFAFPCGGNGSCGKCRVRIRENGRTTEESACRYRVTDSVAVEIPEGEQAQLLTSGTGRKRKWEPVCVPAEEKGGRWALAAFDIGTTSVAGYLLDGGDGHTLAVSSRFNPQRVYGADVISRAIHEAETRDGELGRIIRSTADEMLGELAKKAGMEKSRICQIMLVGNTCMHHLFLGIPTDTLLKVPYRAAVTDAYEGMAEEYGLHIAPDAKLRFLPNLAGFVGADTVGCLLAADFLHEEKKTLMIDIGTNGELVMGTKNRAYTCSTAAGPALEGAKISCGMCGITGAIQHLTVRGNEMEISVIGGGTAAGICGSGLIDAVAVLVREGMVDSRGRIRKTEKFRTDFAKNNAWRISREDGRTRIRLTDQVFISQQDIREVQLAKSAIASGIQILCRKLGWMISDLDQILVAGAFGNYMDAGSACETGLLPERCLDRIRGIGNAAGEGAKLALSGETCWNQAKEIPKHVEFVELASEPDFPSRFIQNLNFEEGEHHVHRAVQL